MCILCRTKVVSAQLMSLTSSIEKGEELPSDELKEALIEANSLLVLFHNAQLPSDLVKRGYAVELEGTLEASAGGEPQKYPQ